MNNPSEKAMQTATEFVGGYGEENVVKLAALIDAHTAEAIAPYKKALDEAERVLDALQNLNDQMGRTLKDAHISSGDKKLYLSNNVVEVERLLIQTLTTIRAIKGE